MSVKLPASAVLGVGSYYSCGMAWYGTVLPCGDAQIVMAFAAKGLTCTIPMGQGLVVDEFTRIAWICPVQPGVTAGDAMRAMLAMKATHGCVMSEAGVPLTVVEGQSVINAGVDMLSDAVGIGAWLAKNWKVVALVALGVYLLATGKVKV